MTLWPRAMSAADAASGCVYKTRHARQALFALREKVSPKATDEGSAPQGALRRDAVAPTLTPTVSRKDREGPTRRMGGGGDMTSNAF